MNSEQSLVLGLVSSDSGWCAIHAIELCTKDCPGHMQVNTSKIMPWYSGSSHWISLKQFPFLWHRNVNWHLVIQTEGLTRGFKGDPLRVSLLVSPRRTTMWSLVSSSDPRPLSLAYLLWARWHICICWLLLSPDCKIVDSGSQHGNCGKYLF